MTEHSVLYKLLFILFIPILVFSQSYPDKNVDSLINTGIRNILENNYSQASAVFNQLDKNYPDLPLGKIYRAAVLITGAVDFAEDLNSGRIEWLLEQAEEQSDSLLDIDDENVWHNYFAALSKGYMAYYEALQEKYFSAFTDGMVSLRYFNECLRLNLSFYESYIAVGTYKYWKSAKTESLNWLPFMSDEKEEGKRILEKAIEKETYNYHVAVHSLMWVYIDNKESAKAVKLGESILKNFPDARIYKWALARAYEDLDKKKSIEIYYSLLNSYQAASNNNHYNEIVLKHKIAMLYDQTGMPEKSLKLCNEILSISNLSEKVKQNLSERFERIIKLKSDLERKRH